MFQGKYFSRDKKRQKSSKCHFPKQKIEANMIDNITQNVSNVNRLVVVSKVNLARSNAKEW